MEQSGYYRKYVILKELDPGFGMHRPPEGFARFEGGRQEITLSVQIRNLRQVTEPYTVIIVYKNDYDDIGIIRAGSLDQVTPYGYMRRKLNHEDIKAMGMKPQNIQFVLIASEHGQRIFIPLIGICDKALRWDETIRQRLLKKEKPPAPNPLRRADASEAKLVAPPKKSPAEIRKVDKKSIVQEVDKGDKKEPFIEISEEKFDEKTENRIDDRRLENKLKDAFESIDPFSNPRHDYAWYKVNDLARLSNLLYACNLRIPLFANPRILVGLFKYRHLLAGFYRSERNKQTYFVLGVPSKNDSEGKPFDNISRWVPGKNVEFGDMTGYWLVYINLKSGEFVR
jgi:hypothetical protein